MAHGSPKGHKKLSLKHRIAVNAYLSGMTKSAAMIEAGYGTSTGAVLVFGREDVQHEIERHQDAMVEKYEVPREWVLEQLHKIATSGFVLAKFKKVTPDGGLDWDFTGATQEELALIDDLTVKINAKGQVEIKIGAPSRQSALDSICRVMGYNKDKLDLTGSLSLVERLQKGRDRVRGGD